jgi:acetyl-CoA carboxylase biotin carboxyl carrier protein
MDIKKIQEFIQLAKAEGVSELKYESKDTKISVNFNGSTQVIDRSFIQPLASDIYPAANSQASTLKVASDIYEIKSPFVGTFYAASSPDKPAYVKKGDKISKGSTLCILEAMKIMNELESEVTGEVVEVCTENESLVEYGQVLFRVRI